MPEAPLILLAAGGTGGHLFPAEALGSVLIKRGLRVRLVTDERAVRYSGLVLRRHARRGAERNRRSKNPIALAQTAFMLGRGTADRPQPVRRLKPAAMIGFGGYPTLPP